MGLDLSAVIPIIATGIGGFFGGPVGAGLASAAATGIQTRDWKQALMSGIMGGGISGMLGGGAAAASGAGSAGGDAAGAVGAGAGAAAQATAAQAAQDAAVQSVLNGSVEDAAARAIPGGLWGGEGIRAAMTQAPLTPAVTLPAVEYGAGNLPTYFGNTPSASVGGGLANSPALTKSVFDGGSFTGNLSNAYDNVMKAYNTPGGMEKLIKGPGMMAGIGYLGLQSAREQAAAEAAKKNKMPDRPAAYNTYGYRSRFAGGGLAQLDPGTMAGRYMRGKTDGVADQVPAAINGRNPAALSHGEFVVDAHTVAALGNGNSEAGAAQLEAMQRRVRAAKYGTPQMPKKINPTKMLPG